MTPEISENSVNRRHLLRGGAVLAGAAGLAAVNAVAAPTASAADGQFAVVGQPNTEDSSMTLRIDGFTCGPDAALQLLNANGPSLELEALDSDWDGDLGLGEILNTTTGPLVGIEGYDGQPTTGFLATNFDLADLPLTYPINSERLLDTRSSTGRGAIVDNSTDAFDSSNRLKANAWMDIAIAPTDAPFTFNAAFINLTVVGPLANGYVFAYYPGPRPVGSSVNFVKGQTLSNAANEQPWFRANFGQNFGNANVSRLPFDHHMVMGLVAPRALLVLGLKSVQMTSLSLSLAAALPRAGGAFDYERFWRKSLANAAAARLLSTLAGVPGADEAFLCGLLGDVGQLALVESHPPYARVIEAAGERGPTPELAGLTPQPL